MNKMTDNEIIKALECCSVDENACDKCPAKFKASLVVNETCGHDVMKLALNLINRQKAREKELTKQFNALAKVSNKLHEENVHQKEEIERLKAYDEMADGYADALVEMTKNHAIKEFAERLKNDLFYKCGDMNWTETRSAYKVIDNLVKKMTEEKK